MNIFIILIVSILSFIIFILAGSLLFVLRKSALRNASEIKYTGDSESKVREEYLQKHQKLQQKEEELYDQINQIKESLKRRELLYETKQTQLEEEKEDLDSLKSELRTIKQSLLDRKQELETLLQSKRSEWDKKLESLADITTQEAKELIMKSSKEEIGEDLLNWQHKLLEQYQDEAYYKAKEIIALALQRCSSEVANEFTVTTIKLNNEEQKGKIIGKSGRNIQWLEKTLGVEFIIDDTPEIITISGFSSIRRHIAKRTVELLLEDGRIHPSSIEEKHELAKAEIAQDIADAGQWAVNELGIIDFPAKLIRLIGRLKFRTSYGQNMLKHSVEMAKLAALIANDINSSFPSNKTPIDVEICIKGALLHDIGKGIDEDIKPKTDHITLGERVCDTFNLDWRIKKCISSHHDESYNDPERGMCIEAAIVDACDNLSGGRIGARKETVESYYQRMESLEKIADETEGVNKSWIMKGNRELWLFFDTEKLAADQMHDVIRSVTHKIQNSMNYPGEIKVIGIWENKIVEYAR